MSAESSEIVPPVAAEDGWHVLIVDDEADVHRVTRLAVKRKTWHNRPFVIRDVSSAKEARELLLGDYRNKLQVAVVDVVMETQFAGLDLCRFIRAELPRSVRIILRTGQPGVAPEERILNEYDIDFYFAKTEATPDRLYMALRSCLRSSQDIETLLAFGGQLRSFTTALQAMKSHEDLAVFMRVGLDFLELKHSARIAFVSNIDSKTDDVSTSAARAVAKALERAVEPQKLHPATKLGIDEPWFVLVFTIGIESTKRRGGFVVQGQASVMHELQSDLILFLQNWTVACTGLMAQTRMAEAGTLTELTYLDRIGGIATVLLGAGRRLEGSITSAVATTQSLKAVESSSDPQRVQRAIGSLDRDLGTAKQIVGTFTQVAATQLRDVRSSLNLVDFVRGCVDLMAPVHKLKINVVSAKSALPWTGFPGSLAHVLIKLLEGATRHAYEDEDEEKERAIDVRLFEEDNGYRIEVEDYGSGRVPADAIQRLSAPGDTMVPTLMVGLKLAVANNIVRNRLAGRMTCKSTEGVGTKFQVFLPRVVPAER